MAGETAFWCAIYPISTVTGLPVEYLFCSENRAEATSIYESKNYLSRSEEFDDAAWTKSACSITTNAAVAPDGQTTADLFVPDTSNNLHYVTQTVAGLLSTNGATETISFYAKAAGYSKIILRLTSVTDWYGVFDVSSGTVVGIGGSSGQAAPVSYGIESVGSGWFRCHVTGVFNASNNNNAMYFQLLAMNASLSTNFTGDGTSGYYIWGAQIQPSGTLAPYAKTTLLTEYVTPSSAPARQFLPYLETKPSFEISIFEGDFNGQASSSMRGVEISAVPSLADGFNQYVWDGAVIKMWKGSPTEQVFGNLVQLFQGVVRGSPDNDGRTAKFNVEDNSYLLDVNVLSVTYAGTGGLEGPAEMQGVLKPLVFGNPLNVEPFLINSAYLIFQYDQGTQRCSGLSNIYENGLPFGGPTTTISWQGSAASTYTALQSATLTLGQWADAPSIGCFRLGGEPKANGVITCDPSRSDVYLFKDVISTLLAVAGVTAYDSSNFTTFQSSIYNQTLNDFVTENKSVKDMIYEYLSQVGGYMFWGQNGSARLGVVRMGSPVLTIRSDGTTAPVVLDYKSSPVSAPYMRLRMGADRTFRVHTLAEVSDAIRDVVDSLQSTLTTTTNAVYAASDDNVLSSIEKVQVTIPANSTLENTYTQLTARAATLGLTYTALTSARSAYISARDSLSPVWNDTTANSSLAGVTSPSFRTRVVNYSDELIKLQKAISEKDAQLADWVQVSGRPAFQDRAYDMVYTDVAALERDFIVRILGAVEPVSIVTTNDTGGKAVQLGDNSGDDQVIFEGKDWIGYDPEALYEVIFDVEFFASNAGAVFYAGVSAEDKVGNNLGGSYNYCNALAVVQNSNIGRHRYAAYLKGYAAVGYTAPGSTPATPFGLPDGSVAGFGQGGVVKFRPIAVANYLATSGKVIVHGIFVRRLSGPLAAQANIDWGTQISGTGIPEDNADVSLLVTGTRTVQVAFDYTGTVKSGQLPVDSVFKVIEGASTDVTSSAAWSAALLSGTATFTIGSTTGVLNVTALPTNAVIEVTAVYGGKTRKGTCTLIRNEDIPPTGGYSSSASVGGTVTTSYGSSSTGVMTARTGASGQVQCGAPISFTKVTTGTSGAYGKWQWRAIGGSFADVTSEIASTVSAVKTGGAEPTNDPGFLSVSMTKTGLSANTVYEFQLLVRGASGSIDLAGSASLVGS